jgi:hypothetical protein
MSRDRLRASGLVVVAGATVFLGGVCPADAGDDAPAKGGVEAKAAFARLKKLAGTWTVELDATGKAADFKKLVEKNKERHAAHESVIFKLTGAGSALVETQMPGAPHEMVSVYHLDGDDLRMTHYCAAQNQPRLKLDRARSKPDHLIFTFDGGSNLDPKKDMHIHGLEITFHEDGRVTSAWEGYMGDKPFGTTSFIMTRQGEKSAGH